MVSYGQLDIREICLNNTILILPINKYKCIPGFNHFLLSLLMTSLCLHFRKRGVNVVDVINATFSGPILDDDAVQ